MYVCRTVLPFSIWRHRWPIAVHSARSVYSFTSLEVWRIVSATSVYVPTVALTEDNNPHTVGIGCMRVYLRTDLCFLKGSAVFVLHWAVCNKIIKFAQVKLSVYCSQQINAESLLQLIKGIIWWMFIPFFLNSSSEKCALL